MLKKAIIISVAFFMCCFTVIAMPFFAFMSTSSSHGDKIENDKDYTQSVYGFMNPMETIRITNDWQGFSAIEQYEKHPAVDIACATGDPLVAIGEGTVFQAGKGWDTGGAITIWFRSEKDPNITIMYAHMSSVSVKTGDKIRKGQVIASCGSTGISTGSHLHLQIERQGNPVNPHNYLDLK